MVLVIIRKTMGPGNCQLVGRGPNVLILAFNDMAGGTHVGDASETHNRIRDLHLTDGKANIYSSTRDHGNLPQCCSIEKNESKLLCPSYTIDFLCESSAVASNYGDVNDARYE